jgi:hypothetical protein
MSENTRICQCITTTLTSTFTLLCNPAVAQDEYQVTANRRNTNEWAFVSTVTATNRLTQPNYRFQYKSQTDRIQAKLGRLSLNQC